MKTLINMTTSIDDVSRFESNRQLRDHIAGFDGFELMWFGDSDIVTADMVVGVHLSCRLTWLDFWRGDEQRLLAEFDDLATVERVFGGLDPNIIVDELRENMRVAHELGAEYVVFHASDVGLVESTTFRYGHKDEEVIWAVAEVLNCVFADEDGSIALLMENLWCPGLTLCDPAMTRMLLEAVEYPNKGIMIDTGHLMHTDFSISSQEEGLAYINRRLDEHEREGLLQYFRGMHLQQSVTGSYCRKLQEHPVEWATTYEERFSQAFHHAFRIDRHEPFTCPGVSRMVARLPLEYLTFEFISRSTEEHATFLRQQLEALARLD